MPYMYSFIMFGDLLVNPVLHWILADQSTRTVQLSLG